MSTTATTSPAEAGVDDTTAGWAPELAEPEARGTVTIADRVVERIAGYAVTLVPDATAAPRRVLGVNVGRPRTDDAAADVDARVHGGVVVVDATVAIRWPESVRDVAGQIRTRIRDEVQRHTELSVDHIDLEVVSLEVRDKKRRRVR